VFHVEHYSDLQTDTPGECASNNGDLETNITR
jgi:hypothetical protein